MPKSSKERGAKTPDATPQDSNVQKRVSKAKNAAPDVQQKPESRGKKNQAGRQAAVAVEVAAAESVPEPVTIEASTQKAEPKARGNARKPAASVPAVNAEPVVADEEPVTLPVSPRGRRPGKAKADTAKTEEVQAEATPDMVPVDASVEEAIAVAALPEEVAAAPDRRPREAERTGGAAAQAVAGAAAGGATGARATPTGVGDRWLQRPALAR